MTHHNEHDVARNRAHAKRVLYEKREWLHELKNVPCSDCGVRYPYYVMDFDHRPDEVKSFNIANSTTKGMQQLKSEVAKCDIVCANCHRKRSHQRRKGVPPNVV